MIEKLDGRRKNDVGWFNTKSKLKWYLNNSDHKQVILEGTRTSGAHWKIICDEGIKDLMYELNSLDYYTIFSCEGGEYGGTYVLIRKPKTKKKYLKFLEILKNYFKDGVFFIDDEAFTGRTIVYIWKKDQREKNFDLFKSETQLSHHIEFGNDFKDNY